MERDAKFRKVDDGDDDDAATDQKRFIPQGFEFKLIPGAPFIVDGFRMTDVPSHYIFFLSHFHSDHYGGITRDWCSHPIYCSEITGRLLIHVIGVDPKHVRTLALEKPYIIGDFSVTCFDANHCPGAVMFLFEPVSSSNNNNNKCGVSLHVGDFRYDTSMQRGRLGQLQPREVTHLFLDTTFNNPRYDFPSQERSIEAIVSVCQHHLKVQKNPLILIGSYDIGKERIAVALNCALRIPIYCSARRWQRLSLCGIPMECFSRDKSQCHIRIVRMGKCTFSALGERKLKEPLFDAVVGVSPTGWSWSRVPKKNAATQMWTVRTHENCYAYSVPYSEHSSCEELVEFVKWIRPSRIVPTVHSGGHDVEAVKKQLVPFHKYMDLTSDKSTIVGLLSNQQQRTQSSPQDIQNHQNEKSIEKPKQIKKAASAPGGLTQSSISKFFGKK